MFIASQIVHKISKRINPGYSNSQPSSHFKFRARLTLRRLFELNLKCDADYEFEQPGLKTFNTRTENINSSRTSFQLDMT